jgi:hypothetical protein
VTELIDYQEFCHPAGNPEGATLTGP